MRRKIQDIRSEVPVGECWGPCYHGLILAKRVWRLNPVIEALKSDDIVDKVGGRFKLTALIQRRLKEIVVDGASPLIEREGRTDLELVVEEIRQGLIEPDFSATDYEPPAS